MRKLLVVLALLLAGSGAVWADGINQVVGATSVNPQWTVTVFNDNGSAISSGHVVAWDDDDTDFSTTMYPYITETTTADDPYTAGIMLTPSCADQTLCEIQVYGPVTAVIADSTDNAGVDTLVGTTTVAGQLGDYGTGANTCALGTFIAPDSATGKDNSLGRVFVDVDCN